MRRVAVVAVVVGLGIVTPSPAVAAGTWTWPVAGPVVRGFDPPASPFGSGHRGIDVAAEPGTTAVAPAAGTVAFAGPVGGHLFLTIDHGGGLTSTLSWLSALLVRRGDPVAAGDPVARTGWAHPGSSVATVHLGVRLDDAYQDPLDYLAPVDVSGLIRLAPWVPAA